MSDNISVVSVPQLGVNDETVEIVKWHVVDGALVSVGILLCTLETSKAAFDLEAETGGYFIQLVDAGVQVKVSEPIALIGPNLENLKIEKNKYGGEVKRDDVRLRLPDGSIRATQKARDLASRLNINLVEIFTGSIIREQDVMRHYEKNRPIKKEAAIEIEWEGDRLPVIIYGAGKGGVTLKECLSFQNQYQAVCFIDDNIMLQPVFSGLSVYHTSRLQEIVRKGVRHLACAIANGNTRLRIQKECKALDIELINIIHPKSYISPTAKIGKGNYIKAGVIIETNTVVGDCCIIDNGVVIAHDNFIGDGCHIAPGAIMGSKINIGDLSIVGIGASIATDIKIGRSVIISVGTSVIKDVPDYAVVEGVPGKIVGKRKVQ
jgi:sugar O-acyltransferase (sialic acid O-acetyltransferase NeuD family)